MVNEIEVQTKFRESFPRADVITKRFSSGIHVTVNQDARIGANTVMVCVSDMAGIISGIKYANKVLRG